MEKSKTYQGVKFPTHVIDEADKFFVSKLDSSKDINPPRTLTVGNGEETWEFDSKDEFLAEYPKAKNFHFSHSSQGCKLTVAGQVLSDVTISIVYVSFPARPSIEAVFQIFERSLEASLLLELNAKKAFPPKVFIGHGRNQQWRDLKDHLEDKHGMKVVAYETGTRTGKSIKEVLQEMILDSSLALIVLTGEDIDSDGGLHARENVIHELGLFQGALGFEKAAILLEHGVNEFSNIFGTDQIRFPAGEIRQTFGDVLAFIKREAEEN